MGGGALLSGVVGLLSGASGLPLGVVGGRVDGRGLPLGVGSGGLSSDVGGRYLSAGGKCANGLNLTRRWQ